MNSRVQNGLFWPAGWSYGRLAAAAGEMRIMSAGADAVPVCHNPAPQDTDVFWDVIRAARERGGTDIPFHRALAGCLAERGEQDILGFKARFDEVYDALCRRDVRAAAYLIGGGCSDDSFMDFRYGLIAQGRDWYEKMTASPDSLADHPAAHAGPYSAESHGLFYEQVGYAAADHPHREQHPGLLRRAAGFQRTTAKGHRQRAGRGGP